VGRVKKVRVLDYQTSIDIELDPVLDFSRLEYVFVVRPEAEGPDAAAAQDASSDAAGTAEQSGSKKP
jgi:cell shape-determining protein MreC